MEETQSSLVRGISDFADHQRWFEFQHRYRPMIRKILLNKGLQEHELDDGIQDVFMSLLSTVGRFQYDRRRGKFRSWLSKITDRTASARRRKHREPPVDAQALEQTGDQEAPLPDWTDERVRLCMEIARSRIHERTWLPFYLRVIEECPIEEVERICDMNRNAVYQAVHRVKTCLREMLVYFEDEPRPQR